MSEIIKEMSESDKYTLAQFKVFMQVFKSSLLVIMIQKSYDMSGADGWKSYIPGVKKSVYISNN